MRSATVRALLAMALWGLAYVPSAWLLDTWPALTAAGARLTLAGVLLLAVLAASGNGLRPGAGVVAVLWLALMQTTLFYGATFLGIESEGAGIAAVLVNTDPLFVAVLGVLFLGDRLVPAQWIGLAVGFVGMAFVAWEGPLWPPAIGLGALILLGGALAWSIGTVTAAKVMRGRGVPLAIAGWQMAAGGVLLIVIGTIAEPPPSATGARELGLIVLLAALGSAVPLGLFYLALNRAPAAIVSAWFFLIPVIGVFSAWPILGEEPTPSLWVGLVGICVGLLFVMVPDALTVAHRLVRGQTVGR